VKFSLEVGKKDLMWVVPVILVLGVGFAFAFGGNTPDVMGHSSEEIVVDDAFCTKIMGHECGVDNEGTATSGVTSPACTFCQTCGGSWPSYQGTFVDYENIARYRGASCSGSWNFNGALNHPHLCCK